MTCLEGFSPLFISTDTVVPTEAACRRTQLPLNVWVTVMATSNTSALNRGAGPGGLLARSLTWVERVGNRLPHPFWIFVILAFVVILLSELLARLGVSATDPASGDVVTITSLLNAAGFRQIVEGVVPNFVEFPPLGVVLTVLLGVAVAEGSGLINTALRVVVSKVSARWLTFVLALAGVTGSIASDAITVVLIPLGAAAFKAAGRSAVLGGVVAFAASSAGFNASLLVNLTDPLLGGISTSAAQLVDPEYQVSPVANYFFSAASAVVLAIVITLVTEFLLTKLTEPIHRAEQEAEARGSTDIDDDDRPTLTQENLRVYTPLEVKGLKATGVAVAVFTALYFLLLFVPFSPLAGQDPELGTLSSVLITDISGPIGLMFLIAGVAYGVTARTIRHPAAVPELMAQGLKDVTPLLVLFFAAAQFIAYFAWTNMGTVLAIRGSEWLGGGDVPTVVLFAGVVLAVAVLNLLVTSGSAQYTLTAPVIVPMFMYLGINPETTQMLFRIGDSTTNIITPLNPFFAMTLGMIQRYLPQAGIGTLLSLTLPLSIALLVVWFLFFLLWIALGIPLGPASPVQ